MPPSPPWEVPKISDTKFYGSYPKSVRQLRSITIMSYVERGPELAVRLRNEDRLCLPAQGTLGCAKGNSARAAAPQACALASRHRNPMKNPSRLHIEEPCFPSTSMVSDTFRRRADFILSPVELLEQSENSARSGKTRRAGHKGAVGRVAARATRAGAAKPHPPPLAQSFLSLTCLDSGAICRSNGS
jgi:hypothetical protein